MAKKTRRVCIKVTQTDTALFELEVPDDMDNSEALERFQDEQIWVSEDPHSTDILHQEFEVTDGDPDEQYPYELERPDASESP